MPDCNFYYFDSNGSLLNIRLQTAPISQNSNRGWPLSHKQGDRNDSFVQDRRDYMVPVYRHLVFRWTIFDAARRYAGLRLVLTEAWFQ